MYVHVRRSKNEIGLFFQRQSVVFSFNFLPIHLGFGWLILHMHCYCNLLMNQIPLDPLFNNNQASFDYLWWEYQLHLMVTRGCHSTPNSCNACPMTFLAPRVELLFYITTEIVEMNDYWSCLVTRQGNTTLLVYHTLELRAMCSSSDEIKKLHLSHWS